jgi:hypothetical protein
VVWPEGIVQIFAQHSSAVWQGTLLLLHDCVAPQTPPGHDPPQHSAPAMHATPFALQETFSSVGSRQPATAIVRESTSPVNRGRTRVDMRAIFRDGSAPRKCPPAFVGRATPTSTASKY